MNNPCDTCARSDDCTDDDREYCAVRDYCLYEAESNENNEE